MSRIILLEDVRPKDKGRVGGKGYALAQLQKGDFMIPKTLCIGIETYHEYLLETGLSERILLELNRKTFEEMRWEEIWDCATRIRHMFRQKPIPEKISDDLRKGVESTFGDRAVVVRSSAPGEDTASSSFAGLHESYVNIKGVDAVLTHIPKVWSSLWTDAALLYRKEIGLNVQKSAMAVVIQEVVIGEKSGVVFSKSPTDNTKGVIESVFGLNQGLVDGKIEPDRWIMERRSGTIVSHRPARRSHHMVPSLSGVETIPLPKHLIETPPLNETEVKNLFQLVLRAETYFNAPQDLEWTFRKKDLIVLQSRPITTSIEDTHHSDDKRNWYLSLHRSFENLKALRVTIEEDVIPAMMAEAENLSHISLTDLSDQALEEEIDRRIKINERWTKVYWDECIPFAHGIRLFGKVYNDAVNPENPYEFVSLLANTKMVSLERNELLGDLANMIRENEALRSDLKTKNYIHLDTQFLEAVERFVKEFGMITSDAIKQSMQADEKVAFYTLLLEMADHPAPAVRDTVNDFDVLKSKFLNAFNEDQREEALELLELSRSSYQLRDDDNIYLGKIEREMFLAVSEAKRRIKMYQGNDGKKSAPLKLKEFVTLYGQKPMVTKSFQDSFKKEYTLQPRQLVGQPAGPGLASGAARIIQSKADLGKFKYGEILICDSVDPNMTFVVPLAKGVVERRGGMLIHGAIIAREYKLPCITGIPNVTDLIKNGDWVTVDGYLGVLTIEK